MKFNGILNKEHTIGCYSGLEYKNITRMSSLENTFFDDCSEELKKEILKNFKLLAVYHKYNYDYTHLYFVKPRKEVDLNLAICLARLCANYINLEENNWISIKYDKL